MRKIGYEELINWICEDPERRAVLVDCPHPALNSGLDPEQLELDSCELTWDDDQGWDFKWSPPYSNFGPVLRDEYEVVSQDDKTLTVRHMDQ